MASYLDKEKINTAITDSTKFDLSHVHITTSSFMQLQPIYNKEMVPGEKIDVNLQTFCRMSPLAVPTYGRATVKSRAYFVPFRTVFRGWNDFITDAPHQNSLMDTELVVSLLPSVPYVTNRTLVNMFMNAVFPFYAGGESNTALDNASGAADADITVRTSSDLFYKKFTNIGRQCLKVLESLGYKVNWNMTDETKYSALPLLAFAKVYTDWYFPQAYTNSVDYSYLKMLCNADRSAPIELQYQDVAQILQFGYVCYDSDYFTSAWDNPTEPGAGKVSDYRIPNLDYVSSVRGISTNATSVYNYSQQGYVTNNSGSPVSSDKLGEASAPFITPYVNGTIASNSNFQGLATPISQYLLHSLHALTDYLKRHQLAGSEAFSRYLARYGKALSAEKMNRSIYLGSAVTPVQISDVMSNSDTEGASLGSYAGKGMAYGDNGNFTFSTDEFGMFIVVSSIVPAVGYFQGIDRTVKHVSRLDFWTPEFESLGTQPITSDELYVTFDGGSALANVTDSSGNIHEHIFGFTPRYAEYKVGRDQVTGNFRVKSLNGNTLIGGDSWHLMRVFDDGDFVDASNNANVDSIVHGLDFVYSRGDLGEYNRIFDNIKSDAPDQFTMIHQFNIGDYAPMKPLYDSYEFEEKGKKVTLEVNGVKHN